MKNSHIVDSMENWRGETLVSQMCQSPAGAGHEPCVYAKAALGPLGERMRADGFGRTGERGSAFADAARRFLPHFQRIASRTLVHLHNRRADGLCSIAARMAGVRASCHPHSLVVATQDYCGVEICLRLPVVIDRRHLCATAIT